MNKVTAELKSYCLSYVTCIPWDIALIENDKESVTWRQTSTIIYDSAMIEK